MLTLFCSTLWRNAAELDSDVSDGSGSTAVISQESSTRCVLPAQSTPSYDLVLESKFACFFRDEPVVSSISQALWPVLLPRTYPGTTWFRPGMMLSLSRLFFLTFWARQLPLELCSSCFQEMFNQGWLERRLRFLRARSWNLSTAAPQLLEWIWGRTLAAMNSIPIAFVRRVTKKVVRKFL